MYYFSIILIFKIPTKKNCQLKLGNELVYVNMYNLLGICPLHDWIGENIVVLIKNK